MSIPKAISQTSESVSAGHSDKVADRISDEIVDLFYREAARQGYPAEAVRAAVETLVTTDTVILAGEVRGPDVPRGLIDHVVRMAIKDIGYSEPGFDWRTVKVQNLLHEQCTGCALVIDSGAAGDQGTAVGFACDETPSLMPAPWFYANKILRNLHTLRRLDFRPWAALGPCAKSQVTVRYVDGKPAGATQIVLSTQHAEWVTPEGVRELVEPVIEAALPPAWIGPDTALLINTNGKFTQGGPDSDTGLTGRKIIVDTYGGAAPHGGGAFSGKDPSKVDRSAAYAARYLAKNIVAAGLAARCTVQLSYAIGVAKPVSLFVDTHGTGRVADAELESILPRIVDLSPIGIRKGFTAVRLSAEGGVDRLFVAKG